MTVQPIIYICSAWLFLPLLVASCQLIAPDFDEAAHIEVHLQSSFDETPVRVRVDDKILFDSLATTDHRIGLAERISFQTTVGAHRLEVVVAGSHRYVGSVVAGPELFVGVLFDPEGRITIRERSSTFIYF